MNALFEHRKSILKEYDGQEPLPNFLRPYFRKYPVLGSRDRKLLSAMVFSHFRVSRAFDDLDLNETTRIEAELCLCEQDGTAYHRLLKSLSPPAESATLEQRIEQLHAQGIRPDLTKLLPENAQFSEGILSEQFTERLLGRTAVFIRVESSSLVEVRKRLARNVIPFEEIETGILKFKAGVQLETVLEKHQYRIQDWASQQTAHFFPEIKPDLAWDVCAGAGGKALLLSEKYPKAKLVVSDVRASVLANLEERFRLYRRNLPEKIELDMLSLPEEIDPLQGRKAQVILCDVPCSGSGTWGRNPENRYFFQPESISKFHQKQFGIASRAAQYLQKDGYLLYITCSVFREENEDVVEKLSSNESLVCRSMQTINGFDHQGDVLFVAVIQKIS